MIVAADDNYTDEEVAEYERSACPTCGSCSGMFTANSMNCLTEALGYHFQVTVQLWQLMRTVKMFERAGSLIVELAKRHYEQDDYSVLPRSMVTKASYENAMTLDIAMGGSTTYFTC